MHLRSVSACQGFNLWKVPSFIQIYWCFLGLTIELPGVCWLSNEASVSGSWILHFVKVKFDNSQHVHRACSADINSVSYFCLIQPSSCEKLLLAPYWMKQSPVMDGSITILGFLTDKGPKHWGMMSKIHSWCKDLIPEVPIACSQTGYTVYICCFALFERFTIKILFLLFLL